MQSKLRILPARFSNFSVSLKTLKWILLKTVEFKERPKKMVNSSFSIINLEKKSH